MAASKDTTPCYRGSGQGQSLGPHTVCGTLTSQTLEGTWGEMVQQAEGEVCWLLGNEVPQKTLLWPRLRFGMTAFP